MPVRSYIFFCYMHTRSVYLSFIESLPHINNIYKYKVMQHYLRQPDFPHCLTWFTFSYIGEFASHITWKRALLRDDRLTQNSKTLRIFFFFFSLFPSLFFFCNTLTVSALTLFSSRNTFDDGPCHIWVAGGGGVCFSFLSGYDWKYSQLSLLTSKYRVQDLIHYKDESYAMNCPGTIYKL